MLKCPLESVQNLLPLQGLWQIPWQEGTAEGGKGMEPCWVLLILHKYLRVIIRKEPKHRLKLDLKPGAIKRSKMENNCNHLSEGK